MAKIFVIDIDKCCGCRNCQIACKDEHCGNDWMPYAKPQPDTGQFWVKVDEYERGSVPKVRVTFITRLCMHCDNAPCIEDCPVDAIYKRNDGLVIIDPSVCNGCQLCIDSCPYGVIYYDKSLNLAQKCTGCAHLLDRGWPIKEPRCVDSCYVEALRFGEEASFNAEISGAEVLEPDFGSKPDVRVYYKNLPRKFIAGTIYDPNGKEVVIGAQCTLSGASSGTATTDEFGDFWFEGLPTGTFSLTISAVGKTKTISDISTEKDVNLGDIPLS